MRKLITMAWAVLAISAFADAQVEVKSVEAQQRYPWNGLVDIVVTLQGTSNDVAKSICMFSATNGTTKAAIPVAHITHNGTNSGSGTTWTRRYIWDAGADVGNVKIDDVALTVEVSGGVQLWENGPYWAECNIGASQPEEAGYYFWWGDTVGYTREGGNLSDTTYSGVTWKSSRGGDDEQQPV